MHLVVGLGNPDLKYSRNRHNAGFMVLDQWCKKQALGDYRDSFRGKFIKSCFNDDDIILLKPMTYMNRSGESVQQAMHFYKVPLERLIVIHDELDLEFGDMRIKVDGGTAGHKGLKSIVNQCGGRGFTRLRIGIGRPFSANIERYVLSDFEGEEYKKLPEIIDNATVALSHILERGAQDAMQRFHSNRHNKSTNT